MKVTEKDVAYVADLANLELTRSERERMVRDLNSILEHIEVTAGKRAFRLRQPGRFARGIAQVLAA